MLLTNKLLNYSYLQLDLSLISSSRNLCTEQSPKESDDTRCCTNKIFPPEDEHNSARNM